jgi:sulfate transport system permease protein
MNGVQVARASRRSAADLIPGFAPTMGFTVAYLSFIVLIPLAVLTLRAVSVSPTTAWNILTAPRTLAALGLSLGAAAFAAVVNGVFGTLVAWVLVRYRFPGRALLDAMVDVPLALPTAVAGIALVAVYGPTGLVGETLENWGISIAFTRLGVMVAMIFVGLPFVVRAVEPVLADLDAEQEEAAAMLGAGRLATTWLVLVPAILPAVLSGVATAFARGIGEYGSIVFIAGNAPGYTEIAPLLIMTRLNEFDYKAAAVLGFAMLVISFSLLLLMNLLQSWSLRHARV